MPDLEETVPLTAAEVTAQVAALDLFEESDAAALGNYLFAQYEEQRADLVATYYDSLVAQLTGEMSDEILDRAAALADNAASSLLRTISTADLNAMGETIKQGLADGLGPRDIARKLEEVQGLDVNRVKQFEKYRAELEASDMTPSQIAKAEEKYFQELLADRRETIARTESDFAVSYGDRLEAKRMGQKFKTWGNTGDSRVSPECVANTAAGAIPIDEPFPGGVMTTPQHPRCRCSVSYFTEKQTAEESATRNQPQEG